MFSGKAKLPLQSAMDTSEDGLVFPVIVNTISLSNSSSFDDEKGEGPEFPTVTTKVTVDGEILLSQCNSCSYQNKNWNDIMKHVKSAHNPNGMFKCTHCPCQYVVSKELILHLEACHKDLDVDPTLETDTASSVSPCILPGSPPKDLRTPMSPSRRQPSSSPSPRKRKLNDKFGSVSEISLKVENTFESSSEEEQVAIPIENLNKLEHLVFDDLPTSESEIEVHGFGFTDRKENLEKDPLAFSQSEQQEQMNDMGADNNVSTADMERATVDIRERSKPTAVRNLKAEFDSPSSSKGCTSDRSGMSIPVGRKRKHNKSRHCPMRTAKPLTFSPKYKTDNVKGDVNSNYSTKKLCRRSKTENPHASNSSSSVSSKSPSHDFTEEEGDGDASSSNTAVVKRKRRIVSFKCPHCPKKCNNKHNLNQHVASHQREKNQWKCKKEGCIKAFDCESKLKRHCFDMHTSEKDKKLVKKNWPYPCTVKKCRDRFEYKSKRDEHVRTRHTKQKPHKCNKSHLKLRGKKCTASFQSKSELDDHHNIHKKRKPFKCSAVGCKHETANRSNLRQHQRTCKLFNRQQGCNDRPQGGNKPEVINSNNTHCDI